MTGTYGNELSITVVAENPEASWSESAASPESASVLLLDPALDEDGDGHLNGQEIIAGTSPTNAQSVFRIVNADVTPTGTVMTISTEPQRSYTGYFSDTLGTGINWSSFGFWLETNASSASHDFIDEGATNDARFYRFQVDWPQ